MHRFLAARTDCAFPGTDSLSEGATIQFPAVRVAEAYDSTSAIQQCLLCSLTLIHPQESITNVPIYTYSFLAYSYTFRMHLHVPLQQLSCACPLSPVYFVGVCLCSVCCSEVSPG